MQTLLGFSDALVGFSVNQWLAHLGGKVRSAVILYVSTHGMPLVNHNAWLELPVV